MNAEKYIKRKAQLREERKDFWFSVLGIIAILLAFAIALLLIAAYPPN